MRNTPAEQATPEAVRQARTNVVQSVTHTRPVVVLEERAANDPAPFVRVPENDTRIARGDLCDANAWREVSSGRVRMFCKGYDANAGRWLALDDVAGRARIDGSAA